MNSINLIGRLTRDPKIRHEMYEGTDIVYADYTLAVERRPRSNKPDAPTADFIPCEASGKSAEFAEKYLKQGMKIGIKGQLRTKLSTDRATNQSRFYMWVKVEDQEFADGKKEATGNITGGGADNIQQQPNNEQQNLQSSDQQNNSVSDAASINDTQGFMNIPDGYGSDLLFK